MTEIEKAISAGLVCGWTSAIFVHQLWSARARAVRLSDAAEREAAETETQSEPRQQADEDRRLRVEEESLLSASFRIARAEGLRDDLGDELDRFAVEQARRVWAGRTCRGNAIQRVTRYAARLAGEGSASRVAQIVGASDA